MEKRKAQIPLVCHGHSRPIVDLSYSPITPDGFFLVSASKGMHNSIPAELAYFLLIKLCLFERWDFSENPWFAVIVLYDEVIK